MKQSLVRLLKWLRLLFYFHQPRFRHLDCVDLVLETKLLLLISWETEHACKISIRPGKIVFRNAISAAVCQLPAGTNSVDIIIRNFWRYRKLSFRLKHLALDEQTLQYLDNLFLKKLALAKIRPEFTPVSINLDMPQPDVLIALRVPVYNISINHTQLYDYAP